MAFAQNEDMIETLMPDRADEALGEGILPRAVGRGQDFLDTHALYALPERLAIDAVAIAEQVLRRGLIGEGVDDLLGGPGCGGMLGDVEMDDTPAVVGEHDEDEEDAEPSGGHSKEIDGDQVPDMVGEERPPGLRGLGTPFRHQAGHGALGHIDSDFQERAMDAWGPHSGFAVAMRVIRALISALMGGRPPVVRPESWVQYVRKRRRCHRRTVSGVTMTRDCLQPAQILASPTQKRGVRSA
jgi:hypothetical protein